MNLHFRSKKTNYWLLLFVIFFRPDVLLSQKCVDCTITYDVSTNSQIVVGPGTKVCIKAGVICSGNVIMQGGSLCNEGTINNLVLSTGYGTIENYASINNSESTINLTGNLTINNNRTSHFNFLNATAVNLDMNAGALMLLNLFNESQLNFNAILNINTGSLTVNNALAYTDSLSTAGQAVLNFKGVTANNKSFKLINSSSGVVNFGSSINLNCEGNATFENSGSLTVNGSLLATGNSALVTINNNGTLLITSNLTLNTEAYFNNNSFELGNGVYSSSTINGNVNLQNFKSRVTNKSLLTVGGDLIVDEGTLVNNNRLNCNGSLDLNGGTFNNNGNTSVANNFTNSGTVNLAVASYLGLNNYLNENAGRINGNNDAFEISDYAKILITGYSENRGSMYGKTLINDESLTSGPTNIGLGFDVVLDPSSIHDALYGTKGDVGGTGYPPFRDCDLITKFYSSLFLETESETICPGTCINITPHLYLLMNAGTPFASFNGVSLTNFLWQPGGSTAPSIHVCPTANTDYVFSTTYQGCVFTSHLMINVSGITVFAGPDILVTTTGVSYNLSPSISGGTPPYSCFWTSNMSSFTSNVCSAVIPPASYTSEKYTLTVTDANGCVGSDNLSVKFIPDQYAELKREYDGSYYLSTNNKFYFKYTGEYASGFLNYKLLDDNRNLINCPGMIKNLGDNRYILDFALCSSAAPGFYCLEVTNEKNEITVLKIKK